MVVKLLREDEISTSWRKAIGEERKGVDAKGTREIVGRVSLRRNGGQREELRGGGFDNCDPLPCRDTSEAVVVDEQGRRDGPV